MCAAIIDQAPSDEPGTSDLNPFLFSPLILVSSPYGGIQVLLLLRGSCGSLDLIRKCKNLSSWKKYYKELFSADKYNSFSGLNLRTHIAMDA